MNGFRLISAILRGNWLISDEWVESHMDVVNSILDGKPMNLDRDQREVVLDGALARYDHRAGWSKAAKGSIAYYDLTGPIMHYGFCGDGSYEMLQAFNEAEENPNIIGHFFLFDTPGGQVDGTKELTDGIKAGKKSKLGFAPGGMIASAGVWIASAMDAIYVSSQLVKVGSIGAQTTAVDNSGNDKSIGRRRLIIRARQSPDKNVILEKAFEGDKDALKELEDDISYCAEHFLNDLRVNRGAKLVGTGWDTGKMFYADEAIKMGLIDGYATQEVVINMIKQGSIKKVNSKNNMDFKNVTALAGKDQVTQDELDLANADLTTAGVTHVTLVEQSVIDEGARVTEELATATANLATANATIATQVASIAAKDGRIATLEGVIAKRAASDNGSKVSKEAGENGEIDTDPPKKEYSHNQAADNGMFK